MTHPRKHVLFIEPSGGELSHLAPSLAELGLDVASCSSFADGLGIVRSSKLLSLVVIDETVGFEEGADLLAAIKSVHPDLPVIWVRNEPARAPLSYEYTPDMLLSHPVDPMALKDDAEKLLRQHLYPEPVVDILVDACVSTMQEAYQTTLNLQATNIRANRNALGPVTAILPFVGRHIAGRLVVGAEPSLLWAIRGRVLPDDPAAPIDHVDVEDLAGEYANLVVGRLKAEFDKRGLSFELGTPILVVGRDTIIRYRSSRPAAVLSFDAGDGTLHVAFCFDLLAQEQLASDVAAEEPPIRAGIPQFL